MICTSCKIVSRQLSKSSELSGGLFCHFLQFLQKSQNYICKSCKTIHLVTLMICWNWMFIVHYLICSKYLVLYETIFSFLGWPWWWWWFSNYPRFCGRRTFGCFLRKKQKQKISNLRGHTASQPMAVAWPKTKTKFKLRRTKRKTKQNKTEKQNSLNYY